MCWLNSSAGSIFFSLCLATKAVVQWVTRPCMQTLYRPLASHSHSSQDPSHILPHFRLTATPRGRKHEESVYIITNLPIEKDICQNSLPCFQIESPHCATNLFPSEKIRRKSWILYLVMVWWNFLIVTPKNSPFPSQLLPNEVSHSLDLNWTVFYDYSWSTLKTTILLKCFSLYWTFAFHKPLPSTNLARNFTLGCKRIPHHLLINNSKAQ